MKDIKLLNVVLNLFDNTQTTVTPALSDEMKTFYSDYLIDEAEPNLVHDQFGQKHPIPKNGGKQIEFRKYSPLPKALTPLTEGVTPSGQSLNVGTITATVAQYGGYIELSDILILTAIDNNMVQATKLLGGQAGRTLDTITREVITAGTNVQYAGGKQARVELVGGKSTGNDYLTVDEVRKAVRFLKVQNAPKLNGYYAGIIHPDVSYDLMSDPKWVNVKTYSDPDGIYEGEIGRIEGVRFSETSEAKVYEATPLTAAATKLKVASYSSKVITVAEAITADEATALAGLQIILEDVSANPHAFEVCEIASAAAGSAGSATITLKDTPTITPAANDILMGGDAGAEGVAVYATMILGADAYGVTEITDGGLQHIVKQLGSAGTADPLDQIATVGWKATKTAERLVENYMVRIESASTFG